MGSNIWPIATAVWMVLTVPIALGTGAALGFALKRTAMHVRLGVLISTGIILAVIAGVLMAKS